MFPSAALRMIGLKGRMTVIDNSGATLAECVNVLKVKTRKKSTGFGTVGAYGHGRGKAARAEDAARGERAGETERNASCSSGKQRAVTTPGPPFGLPSKHHSRSLSLNSR